VTRDELSDLESRLTELEFRLRVTDRINRDSAPGARPAQPSGESGQTQAIRQTRVDAPTDSGGIN